MSNKKEEKEKILNEEMSEAEAAETPKAEDTAEETVEEEVKETDTEEKKEDPLKKIEAEALAVKEKMLRLQADFENYKRRSQKEKADVYTHAMESLMTKLLPVIDNLDRAEAAATDNLESYREGVQMIFKELLNVLNTEGLKEIQAEGQPFDPNFHHGVAVGEDPEQDDQTVIEVFQKGYQFKDKVIRPAMVKVNQK